MNKHQSGQFYHIGRGTHFLELLRLKAARLKGNRNWAWFDHRMGQKFIYIIYFPQMIFGIFCYILTPAFRRTDERYHLRYSEGEEDDIDDFEPVVTYQQRKKPMTRKKYADAIKIVYEGKEEIDYAPEQPLRYR